MNLAPRHRHVQCRQAQQGAGLIEVMVALIILMLSLLGLVGLMVQSQRAQTESYQRVQALVVMQDMVDRINTNRSVAACYAGSSVFGTDYVGTPTCALGSAQQQARAIADMTEWSNLLKGGAESLTTGGVTANAGAMLGARGCITEIGTGLYRVSVVWQGLGKTAVPVGVSCGSGLYGDDTQRRAVSVPIRIADMS